MKKKLAVILALALTMGAFAGCSDRNTEEKTDPKDYKDGVYTVQWSDPTGDFTDYMTVKIDQGAISIFEFDGKDGNGALKSDSDSVDVSMKAANKAAGLPEIGPQQAYAQVIESFEAAGGNVDEMEMVAGATQSTKSFQTLLRQLLATNVSTGDSDSPCIVPYYADGTYRVEEADYDSHGYKEYLVITLNNGTITIDEMDGVNADGKKKTADAQLKTEMESAQLAAPETFYPAIRTSYDNSRELQDMENVAGATNSTKAFQRLMGAAMDAAHYREGNEIVLPRYIDGTYRAEMSVFENGWKDYVVLQIKDDVVTVQEFNSKNEEGTLKTEDAQLKTQMMEANKGKDLPETYPEQYNKDIPAALAAANNNVLAMENVAGATASCNNFKLMVGELLGYSAKVGNTQTLMVDPVGGVPAETTDGETSETSSTAQ